MGFKVSNVLSHILGFSSDPFGASDPFGGSDPFSGSSSSAAGKSADPFTANFADFGSSGVSTV